MLLSVLASITAARAAVAQATPAGVEFRVNTYVANDQSQAAAAMSFNRDFVVVWRSLAQDGDDFGIFGRRFDSRGVAQAVEFQVNSHTLQGQSYPSAAMDGAGDFVVVWQSYAQDGSDLGVFARRFNAAGTAQAAELQVNAYTGGKQMVPSVAMDAVGDFVVVWQSYFQDGAGTGVFARRFDSAGVTQGTEFQVNTYTTSYQFLPDVAMLPGGDFVVAWASFQDGSMAGCNVRRFSSAGAAQGGEILVNAYTTSQQTAPSVGIDYDGGFVVAWRDEGRDGSEDGVFLRRFDATGAAKAGDFQVNVFTFGPQSRPAAAVAGDGDFVVAWPGFVLDGSSGAVLAREFDSAGAPRSGDVVVNTYTTGFQSYPAVAMAPNGSFVIVWDSVGQDGDVDGIFAQRFTVASDFDIDGDGMVSPLTDGILFLRYAFGFRDAALVAGAVGPGCSRCTPGPIESFLAGIDNVARLERSGEMQVNSYTTGDQVAAAVAAEANGDFVVVWSSSQDTSGSGVFARRFDSAGAPKAGEFQVNDYVTDDQRVPAIASDADGDLVIAWASQGQDGDARGVFARRYSSSGTPLAAEFQVSLYTVGYQNAPSVALDADGDFVIAWNSQQDGESYGVFARRFGSNGAPRGAEFQVNLYTPATQRDPDLAIEADGDFIVAWHSYGQDGSYLGSFARRFDSAGTPRGVEFQVNTYTPGSQSKPNVANDASGAFVVSWGSSGQDGSLYGIFARRFSAAGLAQAIEFQVNSYTLGLQSGPVSTVDPSGGFVVAWTTFSTPQDGSGYGAFARAFDAAGVAQATEFQINSYTTGNQMVPVVAALGTGRFVAAWSSAQDGSGAGIFAQRFAMIRAGDIDGDGSVGPLTDGLLFLRYAFGFRGPALITGVVGASCTRCTAAAIESYLAAKV